MFLCFSLNFKTASAGASNWNWDNVQSRSFNGDDKNTFKYFDANYMMALVGTNGVDQPVLHSKSTMPKVALTAMEKVWKNSKKNENG